MIRVAVIPVLSDNYAYLLTGEDGSRAIVDPGEAGPLLDAAQDGNVAQIWNTHHHGDHVAGNAEIKAATGARLYAPAAEADKIGGVDTPLKDGDSFTFGGEDIRIIETPGHTLGHICFYAAESGLLFTGDTLFVMGCGRLFEGTAEQLHAAMQKLAGLPPETEIYCGHDYAAKNAAFAVQAFPANPDIAARRAELQDQHLQGRLSVPSTLALEQKTNPFLLAEDDAHFAELRHLRDAF